jgi:hypothetical protein
MGEPFTIGTLELTTDVSPADWVVTGIRDFEYDVGSLVPQSFPAYARVFHPAYLGEQEVRWAAVARANRRQPHHSMQWASITGSWRYMHGGAQPGVWDCEPTEGSLPARQAQRLAQLLATHTTSQDRCWFAVWDGFGALPIPREGIPRVEMPQRPMLLLTGPLSAAATPLAQPPFSQGASLWWPADRAWCVATDVDLMSTYVGGSRECIDELVADNELEAMPVSVDQRVTWDSDEVNPLPPLPPEWSGR